MKRDCTIVSFALLMILTMPAAGLALASGAAAPPFWQQLMLALIAPVLGTGVLGLFATLIAQNVQARREALQKADQERRRDDERAAADHLRDHELKIHLIEEMTSMAGGLYFALQH